MQATAVVVKAADTAVVRDCSQNGLPPGAIRADTQHIWSQCSASDRKGKARLLSTSYESEKERAAFCSHCSTMQRGSNLRAVLHVMTQRQQNACFEFGVNTISGAAAHRKCTMQSEEGSSRHYICAKTSDHVCHACTISFHCKLCAKIMTCSVRGCSDLLAWSMAYQLSHKTCNTGLWMHTPFSCHHDGGGACLSPYLVVSGSFAFCVSQPPRACLNSRTANSKF